MFGGLSWVYADHLPIFAVLLWKIFHFPIFQGDQAYLIKLLMISQEVNSSLAHIFPEIPLQCFEPVHEFIVDNFLTSLSTKWISYNIFPINNTISNLPCHIFPIHQAVSILFPSHKKKQTATAVSNQSVTIFHQSCRCHSAPSITRFWMSSFFLCLS